MGPDHDPLVPMAPPPSSPSRIAPSTAPDFSLAGKSAANAIDLRLVTSEPEEPEEPDEPVAPLPPPSPRALKSRAFSTTPLPAYGPPEAIYPIPPGDDTILTMDQMRVLGRDRQFPDALRCTLTIDDDMCDAFIDSGNNYIKHMETHLVRLRALDDERRANTFLRLGSYPMVQNSMLDIEEQIQEWGEKAAKKYCPIADCPHPKIIKPEQHYSSLALHGSEPFTRRRLRPATTPQPIELGPLPPLPTAVPPYLVTCHEIQPFRGNSEGPRKYSPANNFPIIPVDGRKGDPLLVAKGKGISDERAMSMYWSSDFFRPIDHVDSDDEDATVYAASVVESVGTGMMGTGRPTRSRRSQSVMSDATFLPDSPQSSFSARITRLPSLPAVPERRSARNALFEQSMTSSSSALTPPPPAPTQPELPLSQTDSLSRVPTRPSTPVGSQAGPSRSAANSTMLPPVGIERDGMIKLTRNVPMPLPLHGTKKIVPQGMAGSPITVGPRKLVLREVMNPLQYVRLAKEQDENQKQGESEEKSKLDEAIDAEDGMRQAWAKELEEWENGLESARSSAGPTAGETPAAEPTDTSIEARPSTIAAGLAVASISSTARARATTTSGESTPVSARASSARASKASSAPPGVFKTMRKRKRPTHEQIEEAAHAYARQQTGMPISLSYWLEYSDFIDDCSSHMAHIEREGGWLEEARSRLSRTRPTTSGDGDAGRAGDGGRAGDEGRAVDEECDGRAE